MDFCENVVVAFQESEQYYDKRLANTSTHDSELELTDVNHSEIESDQNDDGLGRCQQEGSVQSNSQSLHESRRPDLNLSSVPVVAGQFTQVLCLPFE